MARNATPVNRTDPDSPNAVFDVDLWADLVVVHDRPGRSGLLIPFDGDPGSPEDVAAAMAVHGLAPVYMVGRPVRARRVRR